MSLEQMNRTRALETRVARLEERIKTLEEKLSSHMTAQDAEITVAPLGQKITQTLTLNREKSRTLSAGR